MNEHQEALQEQKLSTCPYLMKIPNGDEIYYYCSLMECPCEVEYQQTKCSEWEEIQQEWIKTEHYEKPKPFPSYRIGTDPASGE